MLASIAPAVLEVEQTDIRPALAMLLKNALAVRSDAMPDGVNSPATPSGLISACARSTNRE